MLIRLIACLLFAVTCSGLANESKALEISKVIDGIYQHTSYQHIEGYGQVGSHGLILIEGNNAYLVDTPWTNQDTQALHQWLIDKGLTLVASVSTHAHQDRTGGLGYLNEQGINTLVFDKTQSILRKENKTLAKTSFSSNEYQLLKGRIELFYPGAGHAKDNVVVYFPKEKLLFGGCLVRSGNWKTLGNTADADVDEWAQSITRVQRRYPNIDIVIPGHGKMGDQQLLDHTISLVHQYQSKH